MTALHALLGSAWAASLAGAVTDLRGVGVPDVTVYAIDERLGWASVRSGSGGTWRVDGLPGGRYRVWVWVDGRANHPDRMVPSGWNYCDGEVTVLAEDEAVAGLDLVLPDGATLEGRVLDAGGAPVAGASVHGDGRDERGAASARTAVTDGDGTFTLLGLDAEERGSPFALQVDAEGWPIQWAGATYDDLAALTWVATPGGTAAVGDVVLLDGIAVSGTLWGVDGPLPGASVHVYSTSQVVSAGTDSEGRYAVTGLPPGDVLNWGVAAEHALTYYPDVDRPGERVSAPDEGDVLSALDLHLPRELALEVLLVGEVDWSGAAVLAYNSTGTVGIGAGVEADGHVRVGSLHPGDYTLYVYAEDEGFVDDFIRDAAGEPRVFSVEEGAAPPAEPVELPRGAVVHGRVVDDAGRPVYGATVYVTPEPFQGNAAVAEGGVTDRDGVYRVDGLHAGRYRVQAWYGAYCPADPGYVTVWWPGEVDESWAGTLALAYGEALPLDFTIPFDGDHDGMADAWEREHGLDPAVNDGADDLDGDGWSNLDEYLLGTDPSLADAVGRCGGGCGGAGGGSTVLLLYPWWCRRRGGGGCVVAS